MVSVAEWKCTARSSVRVYSAQLVHVCVFWFQNGLPWVDVLQCVAADCCTLVREARTRTHAHVQGCTSAGWRAEM